MTATTRSVPAEDDSVFYSTRQTVYMPKALDLIDRIERGLRRLPGIGEKKIALVMAVVREEFEKGRATDSENQA